MGWQEEELEKRRIKDGEWERWARPYLDFWKKLEHANEQLIPELQLKFKKDTYGNLFDMSLSCTKGHISFKSAFGLSFSSGADEKGQIIYDNNSDTLYVDYTGEREYNTKYRIDEHSPDIIIKNVCQGKIPIVSGLKKKGIFSFL